jgi:hypothetical protein
MSSQTLLTPTIITKESLVILENNLVAANRVNRKFENQFVKIGNSLTIRKPNRFGCLRCRTASAGHCRAVRFITIDKQKHVDFQFTSQDLTLTVEEFSERYLKPAMAGDCQPGRLRMFCSSPGVSNYCWNANGTTPARSRARFSWSGSARMISRLRRTAVLSVLNPAAYWAIANGLWALRDADREGSSRQGLPRDHRQLRGLHGPERADLQHGHSRRPRRGHDHRRSDWRKPFDCGLELDRYVRGW